MDTQTVKDTSAEAMRTLLQNVSYAGQSDVTAAVAVEFVKAHPQAQAYLVTYVIRPLLEALKASAPDPRTASAQEWAEVALRATATQLGR